MKAFWWVLAVGLMGCSPCGRSPAVAVEPTEKTSIPAIVSISIEDEKSLALGKTARVTLRIIPDADATRMTVRFTQTGGVAFDSKPELTLGAVKAGQAGAADVAARLAQPGKAEIRGWFEAYDSAGAQLFAGSRALYLIVTANRVLVGDSSFMALELAELDRRLKTGEITAQEHARQVQRLHTAGAAETIYLSVPGDTSRK